MDLEYLYNPVSFLIWPTFSYPQLHYVSLLHPHVFSAVSFDPWDLCGKSWWLFSVYVHSQFHLSIFELNSEYFKVLQQFLLIFHFWEVFIFFCLRHFTKTPFPFILWTDLARSPHVLLSMGLAVQCCFCQCLPRVMLERALLQPEPSEPWCCSAELTVYLVHEHTPTFALLFVQKGSFGEF